VNRIDARFQELAERGESAFVAYVTGGDPTIEATDKILLELDRAGVDILELGVPFSDPIADGVVIQEASQRALKHNVSLRDMIAATARLREQSEMPVLLFTYYNPALAYGIEALAKDAHAAGVDGILCVDLPPEESEDYKRVMDAAGMATVYLLAPTSPTYRIKLVAEKSSGFVYYVSRTGVTGERAELADSLNDMLGQIKEHTDKPVAVGFGISTPEQAEKVAGLAEGVVVGSAIVRLIGELGDTPGMPEKVGAFVKSLADATHGTAAKAGS
jgi:tryptophan synthase alpha chain